MQTQDIDFALDTLRALPDPFLLIDEQEQIRFLNTAGEKLLQCKFEQIKHKNVREYLNLRDAHEILHLETSATWVNDARLEFHCTRYPVGKARVWQHLALRYPSEDARRKAIRPHARSELSFEHVQSGAASQSIPPDDDFWSGWKLHNILDRLPTVVVAVSKDGNHVYQNQMAFNTLGSIRWDKYGLTSWLQRQWGSTHADGTPFTLNEYPIYKCAVLGQAVENYETWFEDKIYLFQGRPQYDDDGNHIGGCVFAHDITLTKREGQEKEKKALAESETRFAAICDNMDQLVWTSTDIGEAMYFNRRWYEYTGAGMDASLGSGWFSFMHPDDVESTRANWSMVLPDQDSFITQHRLRSFDGSYRWFLARARCIRHANGERDRWLGTSTDITDLTAALEEARSTREHLLSITSAANVHYWVIEEHDAHLRLTSLFLSNETENRRLYGYLDKDTLVQQDVQTLLPASLVAKVRCILTGKHVREVDEMLVEGEYWRTQLTPLRSRSETGDYTSGVVGTVMNITKEKIKDQALQRADTARDVAVQSSKFKSDFLARMSHEIRTPIGGILGMAQLLADTPLNLEQRQFLDGISRSGDGLLVIINDILDFSKIEVGKLDIDAVDFDLRLVAEDVFSGSQHGPHIHKGVDFRMIYNAPADLILLGDRNRVAQILFNILSNALKFTHTGSVLFTISVEKCQLPSDGLDGSIVIKFEVSDTGLGIPANVLARLFTPFTQADSTTCRKFGGTGLGLTIARQLATLMSGSLDLRSSGRDGEGSVATCIIPFTVRPRSTLEPTAATTELVDGRGAQILVVEDNKINQAIAVGMLKKMNYVPKVASHGQEALDILHEGVATGTYLPDLVLMDCQMPILDGYDCTKALRQDVIHVLRNLPVIAMTASAIKGDKEKCLASGMNDYLSKPVKQAQLGRIVEKWVRTRVDAKIASASTGPLVLEEGRKRPRPRTSLEDAQEAGLTAI